MKTLRMLALVLVAAAAACAPAPPRDQPDTGAFEEGVEVVNYSRDPVDVVYFVGGGPLHLGSVGAGGSGRFVLPPEGRGSVVVQGQDGRQVSQKQVRVRRVRL